MNDSELRIFLTNNLELLRNQNYDELYKRLSERDRSYFTSFLYLRTDRDPLDYMSTIPEGMFRGIRLQKELTIPEYITNKFTMVNCQIPKLIIESNEEFRIYNCSFDVIEIKEGMTFLPTGAIDSCNISKMIKLPKSIKIIEKNAIDSWGDFVIATPKRDSKREQLVIDKSEEDYFRTRLRWLRGTAVETPNKSVT